LDASRIYEGSNPRIIAIVVGKTFNKILPLVDETKKFAYATVVARKVVPCPKQLIYG
jgi:hypothetical protein